MRESDRMVCGPPSRGYESFYREFDSPLMRVLRREAYGEDIGQHSWVTAEELRQDIVRLKLSSSSRFLDLGCGPCGPLTFILRSVGCRGCGADVSDFALAAGRARAAALGVEASISLHRLDLDEILPFADRSFDAVMALDVVLHLRDRAKLFREVARILAPFGRFLLTDAGVVTGSLSEQDMRRRSAQGHTQLVLPGFNETELENAGFQMLETEDRTSSVLHNSTGRLAASLAHQSELEKLWGMQEFERQRVYLETVVELSRRRALSRIMFLAELRSHHPGAER